MKFAMSLVAIACISTVAEAQEFSRAVRSSDVENKVISLVNSYAAAISCVATPADKKRLVTLVPFKPGTHDYDARYLAFWVGDVGCSGGFSMTGFNFAVVKVGSFESFYVDPEQSSPIASMAFNTRFMERIVANTATTITVDHGEFAQDDMGDCCPSLRFRTTLQVDEKGNWKKVRQQRLPDSVKK